MGKALTLLIVVVASTIAIVGHEHFNGVKAEAEVFDSHQWRSRRDQTQHNDPGCVRGGMALSLIRGDKLKAHRMTEVLEQLGPADVTQGDQLHYGLGQCHWGWKHSVMIVSFTANGLVDSTVIRTE